jgi:TolA-binding protein
MRMGQILTAILLTVGLSLPAMAQQPPAPGAGDQPDQIDQLAQMLGLSDEQEGDIRAAVDEINPQVEEMQAEVQERQQQLQQIKETLIYSSRLSGSCGVHMQGAVRSRRLVAFASTATPQMGAAGPALRSRLGLTVDNLVRLHT